MTARYVNSNNFCERKLVREPLNQTSRSETVSGLVQNTVAVRVWKYQHICVGYKTNNLRSRYICVFCALTFLFLLLVKILTGKLRVHKLSAKTKLLFDTVRSFPKLLRVPSCVLPSTTVSLIQDYYTEDSRYLNSVVQETEQHSS